jgi:hypothetical protein
MKRVSLDCGSLRMKSSYVVEKTVESEKILRDTLSRTLRYFPDGIRNCYNLNVEKGRTHLIVARFVYGNYDGFDLKPKFDLYLGPNLWATVDLQTEVNGTAEEILHIPTSNSLQICLVKTGETIPLISALELWEMVLISLSLVP